MFGDRAVISNSAWVLTFIAIAAVATTLFVVMDLFGGDSGVQPDSARVGARNGEAG